ncbi:hypothetical protein JZ751_012369 [Albula glossodonta]|uniref:Uncharacterized protein n=1 Tax=Albula glossodonta TaxID=121402 RepID=A0A8T2PSB1_9TELE|nr:hypothetical protein JZ751_012369 [Albula glossodonta]
MSCSYLLCTILLFVAVLLAVTVTGTILFMNHYQAPPGPDGPPLISTNQDESNALVTVERGDGSRINIFVDPNCPDYNNNFLRLEGVQTSLLHSLTDHDSDLKSVKGQDHALLVNLAEEVAKLSAHASQLRMDYEALRRGQGNLGQDLNTLQTEQGRLIQVILSTYQALPPPLGLTAHLRSYQLITPSVAPMPVSGLSKVQNKGKAVFELPADVSDKGMTLPSGRGVWLKNAGRTPLMVPRLAHDYRESNGTLMMPSVVAIAGRVGAHSALLSESQVNMVKVVDSVSDAINSMQKETGGFKTRLKADLQRAPVRGARLKGCANGEDAHTGVQFAFDRI